MNYDAGVRVRVAMLSLWVVAAVVTTGCATPNRGGGQASRAGSAAPLEAGPTDAVVDEIQGGLERDRRAILGLAGQFRVSLRYEEVQALRVGYRAAEPFAAEAVERVLVVKDTGRQIDLQHLLWLDGGSLELKHERQRWEYEPGWRLMYRGDRAWQRQPLSGNRTGMWVRTVFAADGSPASCSQGWWEHGRNGSVWNSQASLRPRPRRELTRGDDYDRLSQEQRISVDADGWSRTTRSIKLQGADASALAIEAGEQRYERRDETSVMPSPQVAVAGYWEQTEQFWKIVRDVWDERLSRGVIVRLAEEVDGRAWSTTVFELAELYRTQKRSAAPTGFQRRIAEALDSYLQAP